MILKGKCISPGVAQGRAHLLDASEWLENARQVRSGRTPEEEKERLALARERACGQLDRVRRQLRQQGRGQDAEIFAAHATMLRDPKFNDRLIQKIDGGRSAEAAIASTVDELIVMFRGSELPILQEKVADMLDIGRRLIQCLDESAEGEALAADIAVATSVMPSELVRLAHQGVAAVITETCGLKSHTAILARGLGVPLVTGIPSVMTAIPNDAAVVVDAARGLVVVNAEGDELAIEREIRKLESESAGVAAAPVAATTTDGVSISLLLNISDPIEADAVSRLGADGVGLFRTEFLYMDRTWWPSESESFEIYDRVARSIGDGELQIRLADFGAEKCPGYADIPINRNPSLGVRGVRLLLQREDILAPQVRALARLGKQRPLTVLLPMIDTCDTLAAVNQKLRDLCGCRTPDELPFQVGTMIEVPAAAMLVDEILPHVASISIGLNDLTQYLLAADRDDELVESYHDALQPAVLRLVRQVVEAARRQQKPVTVCGELAGDPKLTAVLVALGVRRFSVSRSQFRTTVANIRQLSVAALERCGDELLRQGSGRAVRDFLTERCLQNSHSEPSGG